MVIITWASELLEEVLNWFTEIDTGTTIENEFYNDGGCSINTSSKEINNVQNFSTNKKRLPESNKSNSNTDVPDYQQFVSVFLMRDRLQ
nr:966_t:CDS:2 [Entrophospora candida]